MAGNTLQAMQIGLHVVGNNIANANTPGYIRERALYTPAPVQKLGNLTLGLGVEVAGIVQNIDKFVEDRLRGAGGDRASAEVQEKVYRDLEAILGELSDTDVSTSLTNFFNSINEVAQAARGNVDPQPGRAGRQDADDDDQQPRTAASTTVYADFGRQVDESVDGDQHAHRADPQAQRADRRRSKAAVDSPTRPAACAASGNVAAQTTGRDRRRQGHRERRSAPSTSRSTARSWCSKERAARSRPSTRTDDGLPIATIEFVDSGGPLQVAGGELHGIYEARDEIVGGFLDRLDEFAATLAFEFNKVYSQGPGRHRVTQRSPAQKRSTTPTRRSTPRDSTSRPSAARSTCSSTTRRPKLTDDAHDSASISTGSTTTRRWRRWPPDRRDRRRRRARSPPTIGCKITAESAETADRASTATPAACWRPSASTRSSPARRPATSASTPSCWPTGRSSPRRDDGIGVDVTNAQRLVALHDDGVDGLGGNSITGLYDQLINETAQGAAVAASIADGFDVFEQTLEASAQAVSGVNLDEEAIDMIMLQRTYQASARYISTLSELMDMLVAL